jgi:hypothetical protein
MEDTRGPVSAGADYIRGISNRGSIAKAGDLIRMTLLDESQDSYRIE